MRAQDDCRTDIKGPLASEGSELATPRANALHASEFCGD